MIYFSKVSETEIDREMIKFSPVSVSFFFRRRERIMRKIIKYGSKEEYLEPGQVVLRQGLGKTLSYVRDPKFRAIENTTLENYPGLIAAWDVGKEGKNNESEGRDVLRDLTGNGRDLILYRFGFTGMSGYGGFIYDFLDRSTFLNLVVKEGGGWKSSWDSN